MRAHRRDRPARRHHGATRAGLELLAGLCVVGLLLASPLVALWWWESHLSTTGHHETVTLGAASCASVRSIQSAAQGFWNEWVAVQSDPQSWKARRARLLRATDAFDAALERDAPLLLSGIEATDEFGRTRDSHGSSCLKASSRLAPLSI